MKGKSMKKIIFKVKMFESKQYKYICEDKNNNVFYFVDDKSLATVYDNVEKFEIKQKVEKFLENEKNNVVLTTVDIK